MGGNNYFYNTLLYRGLCEGVIQYRGFSEGLYTNFCLERDNVKTKWKQNTCIYMRNCKADVHLSY